jgi:hypothetical protein
VTRSNHPSLVEQGGHRAVLDRLAHGVLVDEPAEFGRRRLFLLEQRRAGKADVARLGKDLPHPRVDFAVLAAVALVHQHEHVHVGLAHLLLGGHRVELVDHGGDDIRLAAADLPSQVPARTGAHDRLATGLERTPYLGVEVDPVGDDDDLGVLDVGMERQCLGQHDHCQALAAAGGVPDDAAGAPPLGVEVRHAANGLLHGEILLVAGDLFHPAIVDDVLVDQVQQPLRAHQSIEGAILRRGQAFPRILLVEIPAHPARVLAPIVQPPLFRLGEGTVGELRQRILGQVLLPQRPKSLGRAGGGVVSIVDAEGQQQLGGDKEMWNLVIPLVAQHLADRLLERLATLGL